MVLDIIATVGLSVLLILVGMSWITMEDKQRPDMFISFLLEVIFIISLFAIWK